MIPSELFMEMYGRWPTDMIQVPLQKLCVEVGSREYTLALDGL